MAKRKEVEVSPNIEIPEDDEDLTPLTTENVVSDPFEELRKLKELPIEPPDEKNHKEFFRRVRLAAFNRQLFEFSESYLDEIDTAKREGNKKEYQSVEAYIERCKREHTLAIAARGASKRTGLREINSIFPYAKIIIPMVIALFLTLSCFNWVKAFITNARQTHKAYLMNVSGGGGLQQTYLQRIQEHLASGGAYLPILLLVVSLSMLLFITLSRLAKARKMATAIREAAPNI